MVVEDAAEERLEVGVEAGIEAGVEGGIISRIWLISQNCLFCVN